MTTVILVLVGFVTGAVAASIGVGGGVVFVPALVVIAGFDQHAAEGTALAVILPTVAVAAATHGRSGRVDWPVATRLGVFGALGGVIGATVALNLDPHLLRRLFAVLLLVVAGRMVRVSRRQGRS